MPLVGKRVIDIPLQNICENLLVYEIFGLGGGASKDIALRLSGKSLWEARTGLITASIRLHSACPAAVLPTI